MKSARQSTRQDNSNPTSVSRTKKQKTPATSKVHKVAATGLHSRNRHSGRYDFRALCKAVPELKSHLIINPRGEQSIRFSDPNAVKLLNKALLVCYYRVKFWDIPAGYLCPPIPGRADYIHRLADLLNKECSNLDGEPVRALDIGTGANCIYPIIAATEYGWKVTASDIDPVSVKNASEIVASNPSLRGAIEIRQQPDHRSLFSNIIKPGEFYDVTSCNPPFHSSRQDAMKGSERKTKNLKENRRKKGSGPQVQENTRRNETVSLNFGGQSNELWCDGGEAAFIRRMAFESSKFSDQVLWFSTLISKKENVRPMRKNLEKAGVAEVQIIEMRHGQKVSRFMAWSYFDAGKRNAWLKEKSQNSD